MRNLGEILRRFFTLFISDYEIYSKAGVVDSVDEGKRTCNVTLKDGGTLEDMKLQTVANLTTGIVVVPSAGSQVMVSFQGKTYGYVSQYSTVAKILIDTEEIVINGGGNDGVPVAQEIVDRLNVLENRMTSHQHFYVNAGGVTTLTTPDTTTNPTMTETTVADIENTKLKH